MNVKDGPMTYYGEDRGKKEWTLPGKWVDNYEAKEYHVSAAPGFDPTKTRTAEEWQTMLHDHLEKNIDNPIGHEYSSMAAERFVGNPFTDQAGHFTRKLGEMVEQASEQAAVFIAQMRGHFVPTPP
jgi:hypothetical protein